MTATTGTVQSGDVTLFFRRFGQSGHSPILILHGANYYDSYDWIDVAFALATDREVVAWDNRGFGNSSSSPTRNYSFDAIVGDILTLLDEFGWSKVNLLGHSAGGSYAILFAARHPERTESLVVIDHCPGRVGGARAADNNEKIYPTLDAALHATSRNKEIRKDSLQWKRIEMICQAVPGGYRFPRDRFFNNRVPIEPRTWKPQIIVEDPWSELASVRAPTLVVYGTKSDRYTPDRLEKVRQVLPTAQIVAVDSGHDIANGAPESLVAAVKQFIK